MLKYMAPWTIVFALVAATQAEEAIRTNSGHTMTAGTFGLAYLDAQGTILIYHGQGTAKPLPGKPQAICMTAADITGNGQHELAFLSPERRSLCYYDFGTKTLSDHFGSNVTEIAALKFGRDDPFDSIVAGTLVRVSYCWNLTIGSQHWQELPGDLEFVATGEFDARNRVQEVATVTRGELYSFNPQWSTYKQLMIGTACKLLTAGELTSAQGDEIVVACGDDHELTLVQRYKKKTLGHNGIKLTIGRTEAGRVLCTLTPEGKLQQYQADDDKWQDKPTETSWRDVLLADLDGNGRDEVYAVPQGETSTLQRLAADATFEVVE